MTIGTVYERPQFEVNFDFLIFNRDQSIKSCLTAAPVVSQYLSTSAVTISLHSLSRSSDRGRRTVIVPNMVNIIFGKLFFSLFIYKMKC